LCLNDYFSASLKIKSEGLFQITTGMQNSFFHRKVLPGCTFMWMEWFGGIWHTYSWFDGSGKHTNIAYFASHSSSYCTNIRCFLQMLLYRREIRCNYYQPCFFLFLICFKCIVTLYWCFLIKLACVFPIQNYFAYMMHRFS
jgi:hypothetical protein